MCKKNGGCCGKCQKKGGVDSFQDSLLAIVSGLDNATQDIYAGDPPDELEAMIDSAMVSSVNAQSVLRAIASNFDLAKAVMAAVNEEPKEVSDEENSLKGAAIMRLMGKSLNSNGRIDTPIGDKTPLGLYNTIKGVMADDPANPRYTELFR